MLISLDIETVCGMPGCTGFGEVHKCPNDHALHFKRNKVTWIAVYTPEESHVFDSITDFNKFIDANSNQKLQFLGHNLKFDFKTLIEKGAKLDIEEHYFADTQMMALALSEKVPDKWIEAYDRTRMTKNKECDGTHRRAGRYSLKTLAPYFLNIQPFWEDSSFSKEYAAKDAQYTYDLYIELEQRLKKEDSYNFYQNKLLAWQKMLTRIEMRGIRLDIEQMDKIEKELTIEYVLLEERLYKQWKDAHSEYRNIQLKKVVDKYKDMYKKARNKLKRSKTLAQTFLKIKDLHERYSGLYNKAASTVPQRINLASDTQRLWLFKEYLGYDCNISKWDKELRERVEKETTGKDAVEQWLLDGKPVHDFKRWTDINKILTSFFPSWREKQIDGIIYGSFNLAGTRTGRLSSSEPNLQQIPRELKKLFISRPGKKLAVYDMASIEPNLIAYASEDSLLCAILLAGENFHSEAAKGFFSYLSDIPTKDIKSKYPAERDAAKQCDLSIFYGSGVNMLQTTYKRHGFEVNEKESASRLKQFKTMFEGVFAFKKKLDKILEDGIISNIMGRKVRIENKSDIYMKGFNTYIQGSASDLVTEAARRLESKGFDVLALEHDALIIEIDDDKIEDAKAQIEKEMTNYTLKTSYGNIVLKVEGNINTYWSK